MESTLQQDGIDVFIGVDVGKGEHHAVAVDRSGKRLFDKTLPNDETKLRALIAELKARGSILLVVDQPATIGALPVTLARGHPTGQPSQGALSGHIRRFRGTENFRI